MAQSRAFSDNAKRARANPAVWLGLGIAFLFGAYARLAPVLAADFPLNDGGLFLAMTQDLRANHYAFPLFTSYNGGIIPFAYPPLGFFLAALCMNVTGASLETVFRFLPMLLSLLTLPLAFLIARELFGSQMMAVLAVIAYAVIPRSYAWLIMGGGVARALAMVLAFAAFYELLVMLRRGRKRDILATGIFSAGALWSHPEMTMFWAGTFALCVWFFRRDTRAWRNSFFAGMLALALVLPWWFWVWSQHGALPILSALQSGSNDVLLWIVAFLFGSSGEVFGTLWAILGLLGIAVAIAQRKWFFPLWYLLPFVLLPRSAGTYMPLALACLSALALGELILPGLERLTEAAQIKNVSLAARILGVLLLILALFNVWSSNARAASPLHPVSAEERAAMEWMRQQTPHTAKFLVLTAGEEWATDAVSEWFPVLTERVSLSTVQGTEWTAGSKFLDGVSAYNHLQWCRTSGVRCLQNWSDENSKPFDFVYVSKTATALPLLRDCCAGIRNALTLSSAYALVYENAGAAVFARR